MIDAQKLEATIVCLDGPTLAWFQWEERRQAIKSWAEFKTLLLNRFRASHKGSLCQKFLALKQDGTVHNFYQQFKVLSAPFDWMSDNVKERTFINNMKPKVRVEVQLLQPKGLDQIMLVAQRVEDKNSIMDPMKSPNT